MCDALPGMAWGAGRLATAMRPERDMGELWTSLFGQYGLLVGVGIGLLIAAVAIGLTRRRRADLESCEQALRQSNLALEEVRASLETQVAARTSELRHRSELFRAVGTLGRDISGSRDLDTLLGTAAAVVADRFSVHHAGIYLLDGSGALPTLRGVSPDAEMDLAADRQQAYAAEGGLVAAVIRRQEPLTAYNGSPTSGAHDPHWLEGTRSELAVPLRLYDRMIGVLDLQSQEPGAFSHEDIEALEIAAQQVALVIQTAGGAPVDGDAEEATALLAAEVTRNGQLEVPILLHGQDIGTVVLERDAAERPWSAEERDLARVAGIQAGLALERVRLLETLDASARRERLLRDLAGSLWVDDMDQVMQIALREISRALDLTAVVYQIEAAETPAAWAYRAVDGVVQPGQGAAAAAACAARARDEVVIDQGDVTNSVAIPLHSGGRAVGAMRFERRADVGPWLDEDLMLLSALADVLFGALDRARMAKNAREAAEHDQALRDVSRRIRQGTDVEAVLQVAVREIRQVMDLHSVAVRLAPLDGEGKGR